MTPWQPAPLQGEPSVGVCFCATEGGRGRERGGKDERRGEEGGGKRIRGKRGKEGNGWWNGEGGKEEGEEIKGGRGGEEFTAVHYPPLL